ncbi:putative F420-0 ABC transporter substrate-binding protein [Microbacterium sp.]|uniref:putative F420-0 ABC transporter substrate-binding protein n=1 Tax=Microbacterium sp. TaxID=51671 RepID=UPI00333F5C1E
MKTLHTLAAAGIVAGLLLLAGCAAPSAPQAEPAHRGGFPLVLDNCGTEVTFRAPPERVIAIKSTSIEMMLALGVGERIAGVAYVDGPASPAWAPSADLPVISDRVPGQEAALQWEPDLIYAGWESAFSPDGVGDRAALAALGVRTWVSPAACQGPGARTAPLTWTDIWTEIETTGRIFDVESEANRLVQSQKTRLATIEPDDRGLTALWYSSGSATPYVGGGTGGPQLVMDAVGLRNIAAEVPEAWTSLSWEAVVAADPDVIVLVDADWGSREKKIAQLESNPATAALSAVREKRYLTIPFAASEAGVRSAEAVDLLADQLDRIAVKR